MAAKYAFGFFAFVFLIAGVINLMEQITGKGEVFYAVPCGLIGMGLVTGLFAFTADLVSDRSNACEMNPGSEDFNGTAEHLPSINVGGPDE